MRLESESESFEEIAKDERIANLRPASSVWWSVAGGDLLCGSDGLLLNESEFVF